MPLKAPPDCAWRGGGAVAAAGRPAAAARWVVSSRPIDPSSATQGQGRRRSSIDMHTAQEEVASTSQHHSAIINLALGAAAGALSLLLARCTVADRAINAPAWAALFIHWPSL
jgi:hypothetical protein